MIFFNLPKKNLFSGILLVLVKILEKKNFHEKILPIFQSLYILEEIIKNGLKKILKKNK